jgi:hypothetical protein
MMAARSPTPLELDDLREKYARMLVLREAHERARRGDGAEPEPTRAMSALAARWPGALRELDDLPSGVLQQRIAALTAARDGAADVAPWMRAQHAFHAKARGALVAKRWLRGRRDVDAPLRAAFVAEAASDVEARAWCEDLARVARPPRGRVLALVWERVAQELAITEEEARSLVFGGGLRSGAAVRHLSEEPEGALAAGAAAGAAAGVDAEVDGALSDEVEPPPSPVLLEEVLFEEDE